MPLLQDIPVAVCSFENLSSICRHEKFTLVFVDNSLGEACVSEICAVVRFGSSSPNKAIAIIGVNADQDLVPCPVSCGLTEVITFPLEEDTINQLLLKYAEITPFTGLPLTPESPDDDIAVARKAEEIIRQSEEQCLLGYQKENYLQKDSNKTESAFRCADTLSPSATLSSRHNSGLYTDCSTTTMRTNSTTVAQENNNIRQQLPFLNQELRRSSLGSNSNLTNNFHDSIYNRHHTSWPITNEKISENFSQNMLPIPITHVDQFSNHGNQLHHGQCITPTSCVSNNSQQATTSNQPSNSFPLPSQSMQNSRTKQTSSQNNVICQESHLNTLTTSSENREINPACVESGLEKGSTLSDKVKAGRESAYMISGKPGSKDMMITILPEDLSKHSSKERIRRERIKESCDKLRYLLPNISGKKTDMASILEMTVKFVKLINDRIPPTMMEEIADALSTCTTGLSRKRSQKMKGITESKPKAIRIIPPVPVSVPSAPLTSSEVNHIIYTAFSNNNTPTYHPHGQHCTSNPHQYNQYLPAISCGSPYGHLAKDIHGHGYVHYPHTISQPMNKEIPNVQAHNDVQILHNNYSSLHSGDVGVCPHRQMYGPSLSIITSSHNDMTQQSSFIKLPPVNVNSPCSSMSTSKEQDTGSSTNTAFDSPLWDDKGL